MDETTCLLEPFSNNDFYNDETNVSDLQAYYMAQFNLELEAGNKNTVTECFDHDMGKSFKPTADWLQNEDKNESVEKYSTHSTITNRSTIKNGETKNIIDFENIEVDLEDTELESSESEITIDSLIPNEKLDFEQICVDEETCDYIDDEQLIMEELCKVDDNVTCRLSPDLFTEEFLSAITKDQPVLPPIEKAFSKHYCNYTSRDASIPQNGNVCNNLDIAPQYADSNLTINNLDSYSYPNNILNNITGDNYVLPETPTSSTEFSYEDNDKRKISICESLESDLQSIDYFEEGTGNIGDDEIFMNLDELGLHFEDDEEADDSEKSEKRKAKHETEKYYGDRICLWESCFDKYPNQATLVEHIERSHVNTYKGEEFRCLWSECARKRRPFNARYKLLIHMRVHSGHKPNRCNHPGCGKAFSRLENLKIHVRSHTGERPYACPAPHCRKAFSNSSDRAKHQRTHFNARPYACGAVGCGKRYTDPSSLRKHVKTHPHNHAFTHTHVYTPPPRVDKMAPKMAEHTSKMAPHSPVKLHTIRSIRNKLAPELLIRSKHIF